MSETITGVILAGGLARRLDHADKAFIRLSNKPLIEHVLDRFASQCDTTIINANGDASRFNDYSLPVVCDTIAEFPGPLAGVLAAMEWAQINRPNDIWVASLPVDTPFLPDNLVLKMVSSIKANQSDMACASSNGRHHPVIGLWPIKLANDLRNAMTGENMRKVDLWTARYKLTNVEFDSSSFDPFFNINRPQDIEQAEQILANNK